MTADFSPMRLVSSSAVMDRRYNCAVARSATAANRGQAGG